jgi:anti-anti-sigma factor
VIDSTRRALYHRIMTPASNEDLKLTITDRPSGARLIELRGPLTITTLFGFQSAAREERAKPVVVDISGVPYMDSAGLGCLISIFTSCQGTGRGFGLFGVAPRIQTLFEVTRVSGLIPTSPSLEAAEQAATKK